MWCPLSQWLCIFYLFQSMDYVFLIICSDRVQGMAFKFFPWIIIYKLWIGKQIQDSQTTVKKSGLLQDWGIIEGLCLTQHESFINMQIWKVAWRNLPVNRLWASLFLWRVSSIVYSSLYAYWSLKFMSIYFSHFCSLIEGIPFAYGLLEFHRQEYIYLDKGNS